MKYVIPKPKNHLEGTAADLVFLAAKDDNKSHRYAGVGFSYGADPSIEAYILIEILPAEVVSTWETVEKMYITKSGPGPLEQIEGFETPVNTGLRITLKSGGTGVKSTMTVYGEFPVGR